MLEDKVTPLNPESMIKTFNKKLNNLFKSALFLNSHKIDLGFKSIIRKCIVSEILYDRYVIAISGLQGVGKSTLLLQTYEIPEGYIPETLGIGEKLPLLVTEHEGNSYTCKVKKFFREPNGEYSIVETIITKEEFYNTAKNPGVDDIFLELLVPYKHFLNSTPSFMLLPGIDQAKDSWDTLVRHSLDCASTCVMVFNQDKLAHQDNEKLVTKIERDFGMAKPIITLTFSDQSKDGNADFKQQVMKRFNIEETESNRVICTGTDIDSKAEWIKQFIEAIRQYSPIEKEFRRNQIEVLSSLIIKDLKELLEEVKEEAYSFKVDKINNGNSSVERVLYKISSEQSKIIAEYKKLLSKQLESYASKAVEDMQNKIIDETILKKVWKKFAGHSLEEQKSFTNNIRESWLNACDLGYEKLPKELVSVIIAEKYPLYEMNQIASDETAAALVECDQVQTTPNKLIALETLQALFDPSSDYQVPKGAMSSIKYILVLALEAVRIKEAARDVGGNYNLSETFKVNESALESLINELNYANNLRNDVLKGIALILGIDAIDGTINSIPTILNALGIQTATAVGTPVIAAFGALGIGVVTLNLIAQINKTELIEANECRSIITIIKDEYYNRYVENFTESMGKIFDILSEKIHLTFHTHVEESRYIALQKTLSDVQDITADFGIAINEYRNYLL